MSAEQLVREYYGHTIKSTPNGAEGSDGWFHAVYRGEKCVGECHTLAEAIRIAKGKTTPEDTDE